MFPAYRNESWRSYSNPIGNAEDEDECPPRSGASNSSHSYGSFRRGAEGADAAAERAKAKKRRDREEKLRRELSPHSIKIVTTISDDDSDLDSFIEIAPTQLQLSKRKKPAAGKHGKHRKKAKRHHHGHHHHHHHKRRRRSPSCSSSSSSSSSSTSKSKHSKSATSVTSSASVTSSSSSSSDDDDDFHCRPTMRQILHLKEEKWSFLEEMVLRNPGTYFVIHTKDDKSNLLYESLYKGQVAQYTAKGRQVLGGSDELNRLAFPDSKKSAEAKVKRYCDAKVSRSWSDKPESFWRQKRSLIKQTVVPLSMEPLLEMDLSAEGQCTIKEHDPLIMETDLSKRGQLINKMLSKDVKNMDLWFEFLDIQDQLFLQQSETGSSGKSKAEKLTDGALLDRKMAIVSRALESNPESVRLKVERIKLGCYLWEKEKLDREIINLEFYHVNDPEMWSGLLEMMRLESRYSLDDQLSKMALCIRKLRNVMRGKLVTHPPMEGTEQYVASVIRRRVQLLMQSGHTEKAIGTLQAICEYSLFMPPAVQPCDELQKRKFFDNFWDSGIARIGDEGAKGWVESIKPLKAKEFTTDTELFACERAEYEAEESQLISGYKNENGDLTVKPDRLWLEIEKKRAIWHWRPVRNVENELESSLDRYVSYEDVHDVLFDFNDKSIILEAILDMLQDLGAVILGKESTCAQNIMQQFAQLFVNISLQLRNFDEFLGRFLLLLATVVPAEQYERLLCSYIATAYAFIQHQADTDGYKAIGKRLENVATRFFSTKQHQKPSCLATFAEKFLELGHRRKVLAIVDWLRRKKSIWQMESDDERLASLRMALAYLKTIPDDEEKQKLDALACIVTNGSLPDPQSPLTYEKRDVQEKLNMILTELEGKNYCSWQGSMVDLCTTLSLLFVYYGAAKPERYRFICAVYDSMPVDHNRYKLVSFTHTYISLISSYLTEHLWESPIRLRETLKNAARQYPTDIVILKKYIEMNQTSLDFLDLQQLLNEDTKDENVLRYRCYGAIYLEFLRYAQLLGINERSPPQLRSLLNVLRMCAERLRFTDDYFPRAALHVAKDRGERELVREVFYTSRSNFPWSRALLIDFLESETDQFISLTDTMTEKNIRLHCLPDEISTLIK